jgi:hypothetical protein
MFFSLLQIASMVFHFSESKQCLFQEMSKENRFVRLANGDVERKAVLLHSTKSACFVITDWKE